MPRLGLVSRTCLEKRRRSAALQDAKLRSGVMCPYAADASLRADGANEIRASHSGPTTLKRKAVDENSRPYLLLLS